MKYDIPGYDVLELNTLILDVHGILWVGDQADIAGPSETKLKILQESGYKIILVEGFLPDIQFVRRIAEKIGAKYLCWESHDVMQQISYENADHCVVVANSFLDRPLVNRAKLSIGVLSKTGISSAIADSVHLLVPDINTALDVLSSPRLLIGKLRKK